MTTMLDASRLAELGRAFARTRVLVLGDVIADEFLTGSVTRISREAPVLILHHQKTDLVPGGAANAAANIASLGGQVHVLGLVGPDTTGEGLRKALEIRGVEASALLLAEGRPTTTKTRISASSQQSVTQQIVRVDREVREPIAGDLEARVLETLEALVPQVDAILISEYGNGLVTPRVLAHALELARRHDCGVTVDAQGDLAPYQGVRALTPNQPEAEAVVGFAITDEASLRRAGDLLLEQTDAECVLITRGALGIACFERGGRLTQIPAFNRTEVFDVTGAGDTVVGTLTLALAAGATPVEATLVANLAASQVVRRFGTATVSLDELHEAIAQQPGHRVAAAGGGA
ncbi:MAG: PfkB family carbohydrate kinase [bacterium]|nr:PfkB family carbohydrate kinase [bacterium]